MAGGWLQDGTEQALRTAMATCAPRLADLPIRINGPGGGQESLL
jgi:hypothetical protein